MKIIRLRKLNEDHENQLPAELLNMTVGEMLDRVGSLDTAGDAEYEIIEDALFAINDKMLAGGYSNSNDELDTDNPMEQEEEVEFTDEFNTGDDMPSFDDVNPDTDKSGDTGESDFTF